MGIGRKLGGNWDNGSGAGVFALNLNNNRSNSNNNVGCRAALLLWSEVISSGAYIQCREFENKGTYFHADKAKKILVMTADSSLMMRFAKHNKLIEESNDKTN